MHLLQLGFGPSLHALDVLLLALLVVAAGHARQVFAPKTGFAGLGSGDGRGSSSYVAENLAQDGHDLNATCHTQLRRASGGGALWPHLFGRVAAAFAGAYAVAVDLERAVPATSESLNNKIKETV